MIRQCRRLLIAVLMLGCVGLPGPAAAVEQVVLDGLPDGWAPVEGDGAAQAVGVTGPAGTPMGNGSLRLTPGAIEHDYMAAASTLEWSGSFRIPANTAVTFVIWADTTPESEPSANPDLADQVLSAELLPGSQAWTAFDLTTQSWFLDHVQDSQIPETHVTWDQYLADNAGAVVTKIKVFFYGSMTLPTGPQFLHVDQMTFTPGGTATTYDFEAAPAWPLTTSLQHSQVSYGQSVRVYGMLTDPAGAVPPNTELALYQKQAGESRFTIVEGSERNTFTGWDVFMTVTPTRATSYQWRPTKDFDKNIVSSTGKIVVRRVITANVYDATISSTARMMVVGLTKSPAVGATVTLRRTGSTTALGTATVHPDGTYALSRKLPKGRYSLYVTIPAAGGLTKAVSDKIPVTIS